MIDMEVRWQGPAADLEEQEWLAFVEVWEIRCVKDSSDLLFVLLWIWK
jgi:hypothetical protein